MAVVPPRLSGRQQFMTGLQMMVGGLVGALAATIAGPIVLAFLVGKIWGH